MQFFVRPVKYKSVPTLFFVLYNERIKKRKGREESNGLQQSILFISTVYIEVSPGGQNEVTQWALAKLEHILVIRTKMMRRNSTYS